MSDHSMNPRLMTKADAAKYCSLSASQFLNWVNDGRLPGSIPGTHRWDRRALDRKLDQLSGIPVQSALSATEQWKAERDARRAGL